MGNAFGVLHEAARSVDETVATLRRTAGLALTAEDRAAIRLLADQLEDHAQKTSVLSYQVKAREETILAEKKAKEAAAQEKRLKDEEAEKKARETEASEAKG